MKAEIEVPLQSLNDIPSAYKIAITMAKEKFEADNPDTCVEFWDGSIHLLRINFQDNYKRTEYTAVFYVKEGE